VDRALFNAAAEDAVRAACASSPAAPPSLSPAAAATLRAPAASVDALLALLAPSSDDDTAAAAAGRAEAASMAAAPQLLPEDIGYQSLVFGDVLGSGSFSTVTAARVIARGAPPSAWRAVAVKRLRAATLAQRHYAAAAAREVAALRAVSHPGIARLVAAFRWRADVFLLLEHAPGGDLHSTLAALGSLSEAPARFLAGELAAALSAVHAAGLAFGDLKPENIVLTASGHAKLTDFGAARPLAGSGRGAAAAGGAAAAAVLAQLRDGDWRAKAGLPPRPEDAAAEQAVAAAVAAVTTADESDASDSAAADAAAAVEEKQEERLEGTAAYLAPELVAGGAPSVATDAWALGCVVFQCLAGRPPLWADGGQEALLALIADWPGADAALFPSGFPPAAADFVTRLLAPAARERLGGAADGIAAATRHAWLAALDCDALHAQAPPPMARGVAAAQPGAPHAARQNSILWSRRRVLCLCCVAWRAREQVYTQQADARLPWCVLLASPQAGRQRAAVGRAGVAAVRHP
jgi:serine/threonine protein kinase